jgi:HK97 gp10 family phage protein
MPGPIDFDIQGAAEMERLLKELGPRAAVNAGRPALVAGARPIVEEAKRRVRVKSGELRDAVTIDTSSRRQALAAAVGGEIGISIGFTKPTSRRAHLEEFGTAHSAANPFMRGAMEAKAGEALDAMGHTLQKGIEREAAKLAKR